jgi:hypothetical protein
MIKDLPKTLLPAHFYVKCADIEDKITDFLSQQYALEFVIGTTWQGSVLRASSRMVFNISLYRDNEDFIVEFQRLDGSGALFGELYQSMERMFKNQPYVFLELDELESTDEETNKYIENAIRMIECGDEIVSLNGVHAAGEILTDKTMLTRALKTDLLKIMVDVLYRGEGHEIHREHAMFSIAHVARTDFDGFVNYMKEKKLTLSERLMEDESPHIVRFANELNVAYVKFL